MSAKRQTLQNRLVLLAVMQLEGKHPTADDVYKKIHCEYPNISKTTVYRNLHQLTDEQVIRQVAFPDSVDRYDQNVSNHYHFICKVCGNVEDISMEYLPELNNMAQNQLTSFIEDHSIFFRGVCADCKENIENQ